MNKVPSKDQGHLLLGRTLQLFDILVAYVAIMLLRFLPDIGDRTPKILFLDLSSGLFIDFVDGVVPLVKLVEPVRSGRKEQSLLEDLDLCSQLEHVACRSIGGILG